MTLMRIMRALQPQRLTGHKDSPRVVAEQQQQQQQRAAASCRGCQQCGTCSIQLAQAYALP
jgi:ferredoxin